jgi:hypothetical protein
VDYWTTLRLSSISVYEVALGIKIRQFRHCDRVALMPAILEEAKTWARAGFLPIQPGHSVLTERFGSSVPSKFRFPENQTEQRTIRFRFGSGSNRGK